MFFWGGGWRALADDLLTERTGGHAVLFDTQSNQ